MSNFETVLTNYLELFARIPTAVSYMSAEEYQEFTTKLGVARDDLYNYVKLQEDLAAHGEWLANRYDQLYERYGEEFEEEYGFKDK